MAAYRSTHRAARISAKKVKPVMDLIRGKKLGVALDLLEMSKKRSAMLIRQVLLSAQANADRAEADTRKLVVTDARVDSGATMKRFQPKDRGRAHPILKRSSHLTVAVEEK